MKNEYLILDQKQVRIVKALNSVHKTQNFHPWTIKGEKGYYLSKEFQVKKNIPKDFKEFFKTLPIITMKRAEIELIRWDEFNSCEDFEIRAASNPYDLKTLPPSIYHYTDSNGLLGIIYSQRLWATHYSFLNDYNEFEYSKELIKSNLMETLGDSEEHIAVKTNWKFFEDQFKYYNTFLVSFSSERDRLSQWRGYANHGKGYSLGFNTEIIGLSTPPKKRLQTFTIHPVLYNPKKQIEIIKETIDATITEIEGKIGLFKNPHHYSLEFYKSLHWKCLLSIVTFKSLSFKEESEWRAIHMQTDFDSLYPENLEIKFRSNSEHIIPYIELNLNSEVGDESERFPLHEIIYGPTVNDKLAEKSLNLFTKKTLNKNVNITKSKLTLR